MPKVILDFCGHSGCNILLTGNDRDMERCPNCNGPIRARAQRAQGEFDLADARKFGIDVGEL